MFLDGYWDISFVYGKYMAGNSMGNWDATLFPPSSGYVGNGIRSEAAHGDILANRPGSPMPADRRMCTRNRESRRPGGL